jgi:tetratricopeptide (TPR) repeat protein
MWVLIPIILLLVGLLVVAAVVVRKIPQLRIINVSALPEEKVRRLKEFLLQQRFQRIIKDHFGFFLKFGSGLWSEIGHRGRRLVQKVYAIEQRYRKMQKVAPATSDAESVRKAMDEALELVNQEEYFGAEKKYIEIISQHPKHVKAYEALGHLYVLDHKYDQARETYSFALKLNPDDASVHAALGELETKEEHHETALAEFSQAIEIHPNSPRYLDFFIESAIAAKNAAEAQRGLNKLKEVNPENQKLTEFEERITELGK